MATSLYIHIPFCRRKCVYCDFYSTVYERPLSLRYVDAIISQAGRLEKPFKTIYIGGGTPTALDRHVLEKLLASLRPGIGPGTEFTVEANPESLDGDKLAVMRDNGVNRLSVGVQSLDDWKLKKLGRLHDAARARSALSDAAKKGLFNLSADFIFGVPGETPAGWERELEEASRLPVKHISCYSLTYEKSTPLFAALENGSVIPVGEDAEARMYESAIDRLALRGFKQYEVSSFALDGCRCRHNLNYWDNDDYIGLGASAVSYVGGVRARNVPDVAEFIRLSEAGRPCVSSSERLSPVRRARETAAVKIRTRDGIAFEWFSRKTGYDFMKLESKPMEKLVKDGLIRYKKGPGGEVCGIELKRKGFLFCDTVSSAFL